MPHMEGIFINGEKAKFHPEDILDTAASQYTEEIGESVTAYLDEHLTNPTNPPIDTSLSIAGAAADAKRTGDELTQLKNTLIDNNAIDIFEFMPKPANASHNGVSFVFTKNTCTVSGTATASAFRNIWGTVTALPSGMIAGRTYDFKYSTSNSNVRLVIYFRNSAQQQIASHYLTGNKTITVPSDAIGAIIRIDVVSGAAVNTTVSYSALSGMSNYESKENINSLNDKVSLFSKAPWKYVAYGDSLVTGAVWDKTQTTALYYADEKYKIPTRIAAMCGYLNNYENRGVSGIGYIHEINGNTILDEIQSDDLTDVGLVTILAGANDSSASLGATKSTAGDGTICGAIKSIIQYFSSNAPWVELVIISPLPFNATATPFDYTCPGGWSIKHFDRIIGEVCRSEHIAYVSWWDFTYAKNWKDMSGGYNSGSGPNYSHPIASKYYGLIGDYVAGRIPNASCKAKDSIFDGYVKTQQTSAGITYSWDENSTRYHVSGTATGASIYNIYQSYTSIVSDLEQNEDGMIVFNTTNDHIILALYFYDASRTQIGSPKYFRNSGKFTVPTNAVGCMLRFAMYQGYTADDYIYPPIVVPYDQRVALVPVPMNRPKYISFIDDDTQSDTYVDRYYNACMHNGIKGAYAVVTYKYTDEVNSLESLKQYEAEGFNLLLHCDSQQNYLLPSHSTFNPVEAKKNYIRGINAFRQLGLVNVRNSWVIPYGTTASFNQKLAKDLGFEVAFSTEGNTYNTQYMNNPYVLHRTGLSSSGDVSDDTNPSEAGTMARCKARVDELAASDEGGWLIITTHFNEWDDMTWNSTEDGNGYQVGYSRFNEFVQYALNAGLEPISFGEGIDWIKPLIDKNRS